ncbi:hypothetical protein ACSVDM_18270 [Nocardia sp. JW2]|uniref:hypothetical protein n=1 Tax=Nocardia sp. JW2 TaxID=3450738 RepID=UPI003F428A1A
MPKTAPPRSTGDESQASFELRYSPTRITQLRPIGPDSAGASQQFPRQRRILLGISEERPHVDGPIECLLRQRAMPLIRTDRLCDLNGVPTRIGHEEVAHPKKSPTGSID